MLLEGLSQSGKGVVPLSNGMPRKSVPVPSSPPPDVRRPGSVDQGCESLISYLFKLSGYKKAFVFPGFCLFLYFTWFIFC